MRILHGPATVLMESDLTGHWVYPEKAGQMMKSESGNMHESLNSRVGETRMDQYFS